jgi:hypothetical protein
MIVLSPDLVRETPVEDWRATLNANNPVIGYHNIVTPYNLTASSQDPESPASNLGNPTTFDRWLATSASAQAITLATGYTGLIDYVGIARHNFGTHGGVVSLDGLSLNSNLLPYSNEFTNAAWAKTNVTLGAGAVASPIPGYTGTSVTGSVVNNSYLQEGFTKAASAITYTASVYVKSGGAPQLLMHMYDGPNASGAIFNITGAGSVSLLSFQGTMAVPIASGIIALPNGWYRCWMTFVSSTATSIVMLLGATVSNVYAGGGSILPYYLFGADITQSATLEPYKPTVAAASGWFALTYQQASPDNLPLIFQFTPQVLTQLRLNVAAGAVAPYAAVMYAGKLLVMQRRLYVGHVPINDGIELNVVNGTADSADFLGRTVLGEGRSTTAAFNNLTPAWCTTYLRPFVAAAKTAPFFWAWRPGGYPLDTSYAWLTSMPRIENAKNNGMRKMSMQMSGLA